MTSHKSAPATSSPLVTIGRAEQWATRWVFLVSGLATAMWAALVPFAKARLDVNDGTLGLLLLCLGGGSVAAMPLAGVAAARLGCRTLILIAGALVCCTLPLLATTASLPLFVIALLLFGAGIGTLDVAMNMQAIIVERESQRVMMSGFHGLFSVGGIAGAGGMSVLLACGLSPLWATLAGITLVVALFFQVAPGLLPYANPKEGPWFALPRGIVLLIGAMTFVVFLTEGAVLDWGAVFLIQTHDMPASGAGLGYAAFATTMTMGRLLGDTIVARLGERKIIVGGGLGAAAGMLAATWLPWWPGTLLGYALVGAGCANIVPVLFTAVGRQTRMPQSVAVPAITTLGYAGILAGPAAVGFVAHTSSLRFGLSLVALLLVGVAIAGVISATRWTRGRNGR
ncbi:MFS transporter [Robbsia andropogonis]|uniref:MFS transporter n=1 Tax=Robbsia andropogonis TaxID=28092 RepID=UPI000463C2B8|nr:MFS transporter [Robbsia andropogonis]